MTTQTPKSPPPTSAGSVSSSTPSSSGEPGPSPSSAPKILDLSGEVCPYTFVYTRLELEKLPLGATLHVLVDHEPATRNVPRSAREWGQAVDAVEPAGGRVWRITLRKLVV